MTLKSILEEFDELGGWHFGYGADQKKMEDFLKESIIQALDEITPERIKDLYFSRPDYPEEIVGTNQAYGFNQCLDQLEENKRKFLK